MKRMNWAACLVLMVFSSPAMGTTTYTLTDLHTLGYASSEAYGLNDGGMVTGQITYSSSYYRMFRWSSTAPGMVDCGVLEGYDNSSGRAVSNSGVIVGNCDSYAPQAFVPVGYQSGSMYALAAIGSVVRGGSNSGRAVGLVDGHAHVFGYGPLDTGLDLSWADDANDNNQVVGMKDVDPLESESFRGRVWTISGTSVTWKSLNPSGHAESAARGINEVGNRAVGYSYDSFVDQQATAWRLSGSNWSATALPYLNAADHYSLAYEVNDAKIVVGYSGTDLTLLNQTACLWEETAPGTYVVHNLNSLVNYSGWTLREATDINASGQIVGTMSQGSGASAVYHAFLLTPVPEPATLVLLAVGGLCLACYGWRRKR